MPTARVLKLASVGLLIALCVPGAQGAMLRLAAPDPPTALARYYDQRPAWHRCGSGEQYPAPTGVPPSPCPSTTPAPPALPCA